MMAVILALLSLAEKVK